MLSAVAGEAVTVVVPFVRDDEPFVPDADGLSWQLRGQDGSVTSTTPLTGITDSRAVIQIPASQNTLAAGRRFEKRTVRVTGLHGGQAFHAAVSYRVVPWLNTTANADRVRSFAGADAGELPDEEIDVVAAYYSIADLVGDDALATALQAGDAREQAANRAIVGQAVLSALPGLRQRMLKQENDGTRAVTRFPIDFDKLAADAALAIQLVVSKITTPVSFAPTLVVSSTRTDPVTGA